MDSESKFRIDLTDLLTVGVRNGVPVSAMREALALAYIGLPDAARAIRAATDLEKTS